MKHIPRNLRNAMCGVEITQAMALTVERDLRRLSRQRDLCAKCYEKEKKHQLAVRARIRRSKAAMSL